MDEKDLEFVEALRSINVPRNVATMITYLANTDDVTSREIEMGTNLRQPEVSIGMRTVNGKIKFPNYGSENSSDLLKTFAFCFSDWIDSEELGRTNP